MNNNRFLFTIIQRASRLLGIALLFSLSCCNKNIIPDNTISIDIEDLSIVGYLDLFSKIEIIPLETNDESLLRSITKLYIDEENGDLVVFDGSQRIGFCFDDKGLFKYSSSKMIGNGPGEYMHPDDFVYNPYHSTFEFLNPMGIISIYGNNMSFLRDIKIKSDNKLNAVHYFFPVNDDVYVLYNITDETTSML